MSRLLSIVPTETETTSIVLNGPIEGHLIIFHQTKVKFYQIILQPQQKTAPHLVQNAVFTQTGGGSGNNHHHHRHHHQHHINSSSPSSSNVVLFQRRQSVGRVCRSRSIGKVAESVFLKSPLHGEVVEHWNNFCTFSRVIFFNKKLGDYTIENSFISVGWPPFKPLVPWMGNWQDGRLFSSVCPPNSEREQHSVLRQQIV